MDSRIGIIEYDCGNIKSVRNAIEYIGYVPSIITSPEELDAYSKVILPGVGAFDHAMQSLVRKGFAGAIKDWAQDKNNRLVGICLGMQLLCTSSEESKDGISGLSIIDAEVRLLKSKTERRLPNIGWAPVEFVKGSFSSHTGDYYFVHSYGAFCSIEEYTLGRSYYGERVYTSAVSNEKNVYGFQFHPEKSHAMGLKLLKSIF